MTGPEERKAGADTAGYDGKREMPDREERHQRTRELAPTDRERQSEGRAPGGLASASAEDNPADREERVRTRAYRLWEESGRPDGLAEEHWHRAAQDLDREDAGLRRAGTAGEKPGVKTSERS